MREIVINSDVVIKNDKLILTTVFAENNLSASALSFAEKSEESYLYNWGTDAFIVIYEIPMLFNLHFLEVLRPPPPPPAPTPW